MVPRARRRLLRWTRARVGLGLGLQERRSGDFARPSSSSHRNIKLWGLLLQGWMPTAPQAGPGRAKIGFAAFMAAKKRFCRNHHSVTASQHRSITALNLEPRTCSTPPCPTNSRHPSNSTQARFSPGIYPACSPCLKSPRFAAPPALSVLPIPGTTSPGSTLADTDTGAHWPHHRDLARRDSLVCAGHGGRHITTRVLTLAVATSP